MSQKGHAVTGGSPLAAMLSAMKDDIEPAIEIPGNVILWRVLVEPIEPPRSAGALALAEDTRNAEKILTSVGKIVQLGSMAFRSKTNAGLLLSEEPHKPEVGDYVLFEQYAGQEIGFRGTKRTLRVLNDTEILMVMNEQQARTIKAYLS